LHLVTFPINKNGATTQTQGVETMKTYAGVTIQKRKDGRCFARKTIFGRTITVYGKNQDECLEKFKNALRDSIKSKPEKPKELMFYAWLDMWVDTYKRPKVKTTTLKSIFACFNYIKKMQDKPLAAITPLDLQRCLNSITMSRTKQYCYMVLKDCFTRAVKAQVLKENPMQQIEPIKHKSILGKALTQREEKAIITALEGKQIKNLILFYLNSGCRKSEARNLLWQHVNFENKTIAVPGTKSETSERVIPMFKALEVVLRSQKNNTGKVFKVGDTLLKRELKEIRQQSGIHLILHSLRHTFATRCLERGINIKTVQLWLGHAKMETTANIYTHANAEFISAEVQKFDTHFDTNI